MTNNTDYTYDYKLSMGLIFKLLLIFLLFCISISNTKADTIPVGGIIGTDQHWISGNTYVVVNDLKVTSNLTLEIDPGVVVKIDFGRGIIIDKSTLK